MSAFEQENSLKSVQAETDSVIEKEFTELVHHSSEPTVSAGSMNGTDHHTATTEAINEEQEYYLNQGTLSESIATRNEFVKEELAAAEESYQVEEAAKDEETVEVVPVAFVENDASYEYEIEVEHVSEGETPAEIPGKPRTDRKS